MICLIEPQLQWLKKMVKKLKLRHILMFLALLWVFDLFGAFTHVFELSYEGNFNYPYEGNVHDFVEAIKHKKKPELAPINTYNYSYIHSRKELCVDSDYRTLRIVFLVKSAAENFARRTAIRSTWGFKKRFFDVPTRIVFLLGVHENAAELQGKIDEEAAKFKDILQANFIDSYYNNTIKTMIGFRWAYENCKNSKFFMFVDDDIYVSVKNLLRFLRNPGYYPEYLKDPSRIKREVREDVGGEVGQIREDVRGEVGEIRRTVRATAKEKIMMRRREGWKFHNKTRMIKEVDIDVDDHNNNNNNNNDDDNNVNMNDSMIYGKLKRGRRQVFDFELPNDVKLFAGYVFVSSPHRHKTSKWYVTLEEYPYHLWPPYVTAGAYVLSKVALIDMYLTSLYTKHFRFDDIFLGIVAKKAEIEPFHCDEFHFYKKDYTKFNYKYVITSHGYGDPEELVQIWNEQKSLGNA